MKIQNLLPDISGNKNPEQKKHFKLYLTATILPVFIICITGISFIASLFHELIFTRSELLSVDDAGSIYNSYKKLQEIRGLHYIKLKSGNFSEKELGLDSKQIEFENLLQHSDTAHEHHINIHSSLSEIKQQSKFLYQKALAGNHVSSDSILEEYTHLILELHFILIDLSRKSNLILDPELPSYTLIDLVIVKIPQISDQLGRLRAQNSSNFQIHHGIKHTIEIELLKQNIQENLERMQISSEILSYYGEDKVHDDIIKSNQEILNYLKNMKGYKNPRKTKQEQMRLFHEGTQIIQKVDAIHENASRSLKEILQSRINKSIYWILFISILSISGILFLIINIKRFYRLNSDAFKNEKNLRNDIINTGIRLKTIIDTMVDGLITIDSKGQILSFNQASENIFQYRSTEVLGKNINMLMPEPYKSKHDGYLENYEKTGIKKIIGIGREVTGQKKDGSLFPLELAVAEMEIEGIKMYSGIVRDISESKKSQMELRQFKSTLDQTLDCVFIFNAETYQFFYVNEGAIRQVGYHYNELMQMTPMELSSDYSKEKFQIIIKPLKTGEASIIHFETTHKHKDGHGIPVEVALQYINPAGEQARFIAIVRDITERKRIDKMKNEFISTVSHELRTPLTSIRGSLGLISGGAVGELPQKAVDLLHIANNNTERLLLLINDILDIQKIESGQMAFKFNNISLIPFLEQALKDNAGFADQHRVKFVLVKKIDEAKIYGDRDRLMQVMANLLSNAAKFSPEGETIEVSIARHGSQLIRISVTDHGPGIPKDFQDKVFEKFTQSDSSDTKKKGGTGLGLSIAKIIMEKHGGLIDFVSHEGVGTTFFIEFSELVGSPDDIEIHHIPRETTSCILIIEDDPDIAALVRRILAEAGYNSDVAYSTADAMRLLETNGENYKAITLDLILPDGDGVQFMDTLRKDSRFKDIPVVVVSIKANETKKEINGGAINVVDWLQKPIDQKRLVQSIRNSADPGKIPRVLHVEDEPDIHKIVKEMLQQHCELVWVSSIEAARSSLYSSESFDLVLLDIGLPDGSGLDLLEDIEKRIVPPRVVIFSAQDVTKEYSDRVSAVLVKSKTNQQDLENVINNVIKRDKS
ncbi:MAG: PAS domain S-box protein [Spirochaetia bacterium]|nr:PAS domain S-box protein [Spirochaetia bacterium]